MTTKGDCFQAAGRYIMNKDKCVMVHGVVTGLGKLGGVQFPHAWIECGSQVIDPSNGGVIKMDKKSYYQLGRIQVKYCKKYDSTETCKNMLKFKH